MKSTLDRHDGVRAAPPWIATLASALLAACGGGGGSEPSPGAFTPPEEMPALAANLQPQGSTPVLLHTPLDAVFHPGFGSSSTREWLALRQDGSGRSSGIFAEQDLSPDGATAFATALTWQLDGERLVTNLAAGPSGVQKVYGPKWTHRDGVSDLQAFDVNLSLLARDWRGAVDASDWAARALVARASLACPQDAIKDAATWQGSLNLLRDGTYSAALRVEHECDGPSGYSRTIIRNGHPLLALTSGHWEHESNGHLVFRDAGAGRLTVPVEAMRHNGTALTVCLAGASLAGAASEQEISTATVARSSLPVRRNLPLSLRARQGCAFEQSTEDLGLWRITGIQGTPRHVTLGADGNATVYLDADWTGRSARWQLDGEQLVFTDGAGTQFLRLHRGWSGLSVAQQVSTPFLVGAWEARSGTTDINASTAWGGTLVLASDGRYTASLTLKTTTTMPVQETITQSRPLTRLARGQWNLDPASRQLTLLEDGRTSTVSLLVSREPDWHGAGDTIQIDTVQFRRTAP